MGLKASKTIGDGLKLLANGVEVIQPFPFPQAEISQIVGEQFVAQETKELLILSEQGVFEIHPEDVMAVVELLDYGGELAA